MLLKMFLPSLKLDGSMEFLDRKLIGSSSWISHGLEIYFADYGIDFFLYCFSFLLDVTAYGDGSSNTN